MLFVGYPINYETACKLFHIPEGEIIKPIIQKTGLDFVSTDKGQYILGLQVKEVGDLWDEFVEVDESIILIQIQKIKLKKIIKNLGIDLSDFMLERMEGEPLRVHNPEPYLISV
jgi:hypothetical protein